MAEQPVDHDEAQEQLNEPHEDESLEADETADTDEPSHDATIEEDEDDGTEEEEDDEEEEDEPKLKYARLTGHLGALYRNGDATSSFLVAGDKMVRYRIFSMSRR